MTRSGRPRLVDYRNRSPVKTRVRSGIDEPSVAVNGDAEFESISVTVGEIGSHPSAGQPKLLTKRPGSHREEIEETRASLVLSRERHT